jgi:hypothetical protein
MNQIELSKELVTPMFVGMLDMFDVQLARYIQFMRCSVNRLGHLMFEFQSSNHHVQFQLQGLKLRDENDVMRANIHFSEMYDYFRDIKYDHIGWKYKV